MEVSGWGHINFDHFRFHDAPPTIAERAPEAGNRRRLPYAGLPAEEAAQGDEIAGRVFGDCGCAPSRM